MPNYSGSWTLQSQMQAQGASTWPAPFVPVYIEDTFSTYLYNGASAAQTIVNGVNLSANGGMVWAKSRSNAISNIVVDTVRGGTNALITNLTDANSADPGFHISSFNTTGYSLQGAGSGDNFSGYTYVSWTFRKQPKFFDIVTYTGTGAVQNIAHNLGSVPGCVITKKTSATSNWAVYHRGITSSQNGAIILNLPDAFVTSAAVWNNTAPTSTQFTVGTADATNISGQTYVAYLFAHDAGGFGLTGTDNVISCGTFTTDGTGAAGNITLGYESQWVMFKRSDGVGNWQIVDTMRGSSLTFYSYISPTVSNAESSSTSAGQGIFPTATGFYVGNNFPGANQTYIYVAIRRGPMAVPLLGTSVFNPSIFTANGIPTAANTNYSLPFFDMVMQAVRSPGGAATSPWVVDRLRGQSAYITTSSTNAENSYGGFAFVNNDGFSMGPGSSELMADYRFRRAPGFFDEVCYTGTGSARTVAHNLAAVPELMIVKNRVNARNWRVYVAPLGAASSLNLNTDAADGGLGAALWNSTAPTASVFSLGTDSSVNASADTYVAYLFATVAGVSKVGSYTGTGLGNMQQINCGFTTGARFVLIKRTNSTGDWYVWDSARGIVAGNDPYLLMNSTAAEVTTTDYVDTLATGFEVSATAPAALNATGGTYIFLAIA